MKRLKRSYRQTASTSRSRRAKNKRMAPHTVEEFFAMPEELQDRWTAVVSTITKMRADNISLRQAAKEFEIKPHAVIRLGGKALRKRVNGRYAAKSSDRLLRVEVLPESSGLREIGVPDSRQASLIGKYWNAVRRYVDSPGDASALQEYEGKNIIDANGTQVPLLTNLAELDRLGSAGVLSFESVYAKAA